MSAGDVFLLVVRWLHLVSAAAWVGGSLFYLLVLRPALRRSGDPSGVTESAAVEFKALVETSIIVILVTGIILTFNRLTPGVVGVPYVAVLGVKIALSLWMFVIARSRRKRQLLPSHQMPSAVSGWRRFARAISGYNTVVILGIVVFLLSDLLKVLFEIALRG